MTMTRTLKYGKGYAGKLSNKCWAAIITGSDQKYGLSREFLEPTNVVREHFNRPRTIIHFSFELALDCMYELSEGGERWFVGIYADKEGKTKSMKLSDSRVKAWVAALDEGKSGKEARIASKGL